MEQQEIYEIFYNYISNIIDCRIDELYESTLIFGQTLHYVPDLKQMNMLPYNKDFSSIFSIHFLLRFYVLSLDKF